MSSFFGFSRETLDASFLHWMTTWTYYRSRDRKESFCKIQVFIELTGQREDFDKFCDYNFKDGKINTKKKILGDS